MPGFVQIDLKIFVQTILAIIPEPAGYKTTQRLLYAFQSVKKREVDNEHRKDLKSQLSFLFTEFYSGCLSFICNIISFIILFVPYSLCILDSFNSIFIHRRL